MIWAKKSFFRVNSKTHKANKAIRRNKKGDVRNTAFKLQSKKSLFTISTEITAWSVSRTSLLTRLSLLDMDCSTVELAAVQFRDSLTGSLIIRHLDKAETSGLLCLPIKNHLGRRDFPILFKQITQVRISNSVTQI